MSSFREALKPKWKDLWLIAALIAIHYDFRITGGFILGAYVFSG